MTNEIQIPKSYAQHNLYRNENYEMRTTDQGLIKVTRAADHATMFYTKNDARMIALASVF